MPMMPKTHQGRGQPSAAQAERDYERLRGSAAKRGYDKDWRIARADYLEVHRWCVMCAKQGVRTRSTVVDHIIPHRGDKRLFWDKTNWQPLCKDHHDSDKQAIEKKRR